MSRPRTLLAALTLAPLLLGALFSGCLAQAQEDGGRRMSLPRALIGDDPYRTLILEVDVAQGVSADPAALETLRHTLKEITGKQSVLLVGPESIPAQGGGYGNDDLRRIHRRTADVAVTEAGVHGLGSTATLHILYLDGQPQTKGDHLSAGRLLAEDGLIVLFPETFRAAHTMRNGLIVSLQGEAETSVLLHEAGHAVGLVNRGVAMTVPHEDSQHPGHSTNPASVMYPFVPIQPNGFVTRDLPVAFDADDLRDLRAFRSLVDPR